MRGASVVFAALAAANAIRRRRRVAPAGGRCAGRPSHPWKVMKVFGRQRELWRELWLNRLAASGSSRDLKHGQTSRFL